MARYRPVDYSQEKLIPINYANQILPGTIEHTLSYLVDSEIDLSVFDSNYCNDETGAPAIDPAVLLKVILFAYTRGIFTSRDIAQCCRENVIFMALSADTQPHFTTIASFVSGMDEQISHLFTDVLMVCDEVHLLGGDMIAIDGCKLSSNASKEWSGTKEELSGKKDKYEKMAFKLIEKHKQSARDLDESRAQRELKAIENLKAKAKKIRDWLKDNDDKPGKRGKPLKSNITDNDSAKMGGTKNGTIQGYVGVNAIDSANQVALESRAFGQGPENDLLQPILEGVTENLEAIGQKDPLRSVKVTADTGFYSTDNVNYVYDNAIDAYLPDGPFRKRDKRFENVEKYKSRSRKEKQKREGRQPQIQYTNDQFEHDKKRNKAICPAGKALYSTGVVTDKRGVDTYRFKGAKRDCVPCAHRRQCLRNPDKTSVRQVSFYKSTRDVQSKRRVDRMKDKIDSEHGRHEYSRRMEVVEPVFGNVTYALGLHRFTLRGSKKVNIQWKMFNIVHNMMKIHRYGVWGELEPV